MTYPSWRVNRPGSECCQPTVPTIDSLARLQVRWRPDCESGDHPQDLAYGLGPDEFEALWAPYEAAMPDLYRFRSEAFVFETVEELEEVLRTPGLAEVIVMEGYEPRDRWDLRCASCGEEFIPFGWHEWRGTTCELCRNCPTIAFGEPEKTEGGETIHLMRVFPVGGVDVVWPPR